MALWLLVQAFAALQKDFEQLVTGSFDGTLAIWDIRSTAGAAAIQPELVARWHAHGDKVRPAIGGGGGAAAAETAAALPAVGRAPAGAGSGGAAAVAGAMPAAAARPEVRCLHFVPEARLLLSGGNDAKIKVRHSRSC